MPSILKMAEWLQASLAIQASKDLKAQTKALEEAWGLYHPVASRRRWQSEIFDKKRKVFQDCLWSLEYGILFLYVRHSSKSAGLQEAQKALDQIEGLWYALLPLTLDDYKARRSKFQEGMDTLKYLEPYLKNLPRLSKEDALKGWWSLVEIERESCLKAWQVFYKAYKEECKAKDKKRIKWRDLGAETRRAWGVFNQSYWALKESLGDLLACADRILGVHAVREVVVFYAWDWHNMLGIRSSGEDGFNALKKALEGVGIVSTDKKVLESKEALKQCLKQMLELHRKDKENQNGHDAYGNFFRAFFKPSLEAFLHACDVSLGVAVARQVLEIEKVKNADDYDKSGFKKALEKGFLKPLEERFQALGVAVNPNLALDALKATLQRTLLKSNGAFMDLDGDYEEFEKEGVVALEDVRELEKNLMQCKEPLKTSLKALVSNDASLAQMATQALEKLKWFKDTGEALNILEKILGHLKGTESTPTPTMDEAQIHVFIKEQLEQEKQRYAGVSGEKIAGLAKPLWYYRGENLQAYADYSQESAKSATACLELGKMAMHGIVLPKSFDLARSYFERAIDLGSIRALTHLGLLYLDLAHLRFGQGAKRAGSEGIFNERVQKALECFKNALILGDICAYVGLEKIKHLCATNKTDKDLTREIDAFNDTLVAHSKESVELLHYTSFKKFIKSYKKADIEAQVRLDGISEVCLYKHYFSYGDHIDKECGIDRDYVENCIEPMFGGISCRSFYAAMDGTSARSHLNILKAISKVYGTPKKSDYQNRYDRAQEAYLMGIALGSGRCALELGYMQITHFTRNLGFAPPKRRDQLALEANHSIIACFKKALQKHFNSALNPLLELLQAQQDLLAKMPNHPSHKDLSAQYAHDLEQVKLYEKALKQSKRAKDPMQWEVLSFVPEFMPNANFVKEPEKSKPKESIKPLWQYGANTKQAFRDYMHAKDQGSVLAWVELGKMSFMGVVVPPDPIGAMVCFKKAKELGVAYDYHDWVKEEFVANHYEGVYAERIKHDSQPDYNNPLKGADLKEGEACLFASTKPADVSEFLDSFTSDMDFSDYTGCPKENQWGIWRWGLDDWWDTSQVEEILEDMEKQAKGGDIPMHAWRGIFCMSVGYEEPDLWDLYQLKPWERKNVLRRHTNKAYTDIMRAINKGYVDGYYMLGIDDLHNMYGFWRTLQGMRKRMIKEDGDDQDTQEEEYLKGLTPDDPEDEGAEFYANKRKESLQSGAKAGSALCAVALIQLVEKETQATTQELFEKRHEWIAMLTPFWEEQGHYKALDKLIGLLEQQISFCKGTEANKSAQERHKHYKDALECYKAHLARMGYSPEMLREYYREDCSLFI
ncbi:hypothetical protein NHP200010_11730 [Helicobacter bizzozeronii]|uniref:hypothetical protein n=1 Tax=Helicobacter bizzozeronii TaxID=56877 RepID=UPI00244D90C0|nr:hypothetical protein [Helicobacter bizzozeronii]GMB93453.1 hypothetical protein NHP200010_11730 [Helicobacter bizzozeronii]